MSIRQQLEKHPKAIAAGAALVIFCVAAYVAYPFFSKPPKYVPPANAYFYDLSNGEVFAARAQSIPPIDRNAAKAVRAYVFSCGDCDSEKDRFVGYILKLTDEAKRKYELTSLGKQGLFEAPLPLNRMGTLPGVTLGEIKKPTTAPAAKVSSIGGTHGTLFMVASVPAEFEPGAPPHWLPLEGSDAANLFKKVTARCGKTPRDCSPPNQE